LVPDGIAVPARRPTATPDDAPAVLTFIANFAYQPNVDAAVYFVRQVLPLVAASIPDVRLLLVGNAPPPEVLALAGPAVTVTGRVPDVDPYLEEATAVVCPLRIGGGVKVKMLEALSSGKAIVSTSVGVQGLGRDITDAVLVTDDPAQMAQHTVAVLTDPLLRHQLERAAARHATTMPTWDDAADALLACYELAVARRERMDA